MKITVNTIQNEEGFVLITGLMILVILTLLGIAATRNTSIELQIAGNDKLHKETFYAAEADDILGTEVLEQNFACPVGFDPTGPNYADIENSIRVYNRRIDRTDPSTSADKMNAIAIWRNAQLVSDNFDSSHAAYYVPNINEADVAFPLSNLDPNNDGNPDDNLPGTSYLYIAGEIQ